MTKNKKTSTRGAGKGQKLLSSTRDQIIKDLQRVHKLFPTAVPDRDFYRIHGRYSDAEWKAHFPKFKDFAAAAQVKLTPETAFAKAASGLDTVIDLVKRFEDDWDKYQMDGVYVRIVELRELFTAWQIVTEMDEDGNDLPQSEIEARLAKAKSAPLVRLEMPKGKR